MGNKNKKAIKQLALFNWASKLVDIATTTNKTAFLQVKEDGTIWVEV
jgi:hypothetical protein